MAKRAGLPIARFVAATNVNDVVPAYLETGTFRAAAVGADDRQRDGRRPSEQLRADALAVRQRRRRDAPRHRRQPASATTRCGRRSGGSTRRAGICSIRTARSRTWGSTGGRAGWRDGRDGQDGRASFSPPRIRRSSRDRRADHRPADREAGAALAEALRGRGTSCGSTRRSRRSRRCSMADPFRYRADVLAQLWAHGVQPTERTTPGARARLRARSVQVRDPAAARALSPQGVSKDRVRRTASMRCAAAIRCSRCFRASSSSRRTQGTGASSALFTTVVSPSTESIMPASRSGEPLMCQRTWEVAQLFSRAALTPKAAIVFSSRETTGSGSRATERAASAWPLRRGSRAWR